MPLPFIQKPGIIRFIFSTQSSSTMCWIKTEQTADEVFTDAYAKLVGEIGFPYNKVRNLCNQHEDGTTAEIKVEMAELSHYTVTLLFNELLPAPSLL